MQLARYQFLMSDTTFGPSKSINLLRLSASLGDFPRTANPLSAQQLVSARLQGLRRLADPESSVQSQ